MDFGIILGDIPTTVSEKDHFDSILRQVEAAQRAAKRTSSWASISFSSGHAGCSRCPCWARLAGELDPHVRL